MKMFNSYYDNRLQKAMPIEDLRRHFGENGTLNLDVACGEEYMFSAKEWLSMSEEEKQNRLMTYHLHS